MGLPLLSHNDINPTTYLQSGNILMEQPKYWVKTKIYGGTKSWVMLTDHIGQAKLFAYIYATFNRSNGEWVNNRIARAAITPLCGIEEATIFNYLSKLVKCGLLLKSGRGLYRINPQYISYGNHQ